MSNQVNSPVQHYNTPSFNNCCKLCTCPLDFGCIPACKDLYLNFEAPITGQYTVYFQYRGQLILKKLAFHAGSDFYINLSKLNRNYLFIAVIYDPNGEQITIEHEGKEYNCIQFKTEIIKGIC